MNRCTFQRGCILRQGCISRHNTSFRCMRFKFPKCHCHVNEEAKHVYTTQLVKLYELFAISNNKKMLTCSNDKNIALCTPSFISLCVQMKSNWTPYCQFDPPLQNSGLFNKHGFPYIY